MCQDRGCILSILPILVNHRISEALKWTGRGRFTNRPYGGLAGERREFTG